MKIDWHIIAKIISGFFIIPIAILGNILWPWWSKQRLSVRIISAPIVLPIVGLAALGSYWWNSY